MNTGKICQAETHSIQKFVTLAFISMSQDFFEVVEVLFDLNFGWVTLIEPSKVEQMFPMKYITFSEA